MNQKRFSSQMQHFASHSDKNLIASNSSEEPQMTSRSSYSSRALKLPEKTSIPENVFLKTADGTFKCLRRAKIPGFSCAVQHHAVRVNPHNPHKHSLKTTDWKKAHLHWADCSKHRTSVLS